MPVPAALPTSPFWLPTLLRGLVGAAIVALGTASGCTYSNGGDPSPASAVPCDTTAQAVTYAKVISPIFDTHCRECHSQSKASAMGGGINFGDYDGINRYPTAVLLGSIQHSRGYDPMPLGRDRIPACDIARIRAWMAAGKPNN